MLKVIEPLRIPDQLASKVGKLDLMGDVPFWGTNWKIRRCIKKQLNERIDLLWDAYWDDGCKIDVAKEILDIFQEYTSMPKAILLPDDPLQYVFAIAGEDMKAICVMSRICDRYGLSGNFFSEMDKLKFGELVAACRHAGEVDFDALERSDLNVDHKTDTP